MEYFDRYVLANMQAYHAAEADLTKVAVAQVPETSPEYTAAVDAVMVAAMNAATSAYHLADNIFQQHATANPATVYGCKDLKDYRDFLDKHKCIYVGENRTCDDLSLLGAVVDAYKHFDLRNMSRPVTSASATVAIANGWGSLPYGEGKFGGVPEVTVRLNSGHLRALHKILQNVIEMWKLEIQAHGL